MTEEEKELLLKDLCARLPYEVKCQIDYDNEEDAYLGIERYCDDIIVSVCIETEEIGLYEASEYFYPGEFKPYLRPMSSMTEDEKKYIADKCAFTTIGPIGDNSGLMMPVIATEWLIDFYNSHYIDWRGLIPKGLALEAKEGMYD